MKDLAYYNGEITTIDGMKIPIGDRVCWFGDGIYEAALGNQGAIFGLDDHLKRMYASAAAVQLDIKMNQEEFKDLALSLAKKVEGDILFVYWQITRGGGLRQHKFPQEAKANIWFTIRPYDMGDMKKKVKLITQEDKRFFFCNVKTLNLLPNVLANQKAASLGCYEAVFHRGERVTEGTHSNIHIIKDGKFQTAPLDNLILPGITRMQLIRLCGKLKIEVIEKPFTVNEMFEADEIITSSSTAFALGVSHIDDKAVGGRAGEVLNALQEGMGEEFDRELGR